MAAQHHSLKKLNDIMGMQCDTVIPAEAPKCIGKDRVQVLVVLRSEAWAQESRVYTVRGPHLHPKVVSPKDI